MRDNERTLSGARSLSIVAISAALPFLVPDYGWWPVVVAAVYIAYARFADHKYATSSEPEGWMFSVTLVSQAMFAGAAAASGGPTSAAMLWLAVAMGPMTARYGTRATVVGGCFSLLCLFAAALSHGFAALVESPDITVVTLSTAISCLGYGVGMRRNEFTQRRAAYLDPLTGLLNRTNLADRFEEVRQVAMARDRSVAVLLFDLDRFKQVNDVHGHATGDAVLVAAAYELRRALPDHEMIYRLGGEEFAAILPDADLVAATAHAERVRLAIARANPGGVAVTTSVGLAVATRATIDRQTMFDAADAALYDAKRAGRNRVISVDLGARAAARSADPGPAPKSSDPDSGLRIVA